MEPAPSLSLEDSFLEQLGAETSVRDFLDALVTNCAKIIHSHYLTTQIKPYASRTIAHELVLNASWAKLPAGQQIFGITPDDDLEIERVDQWCNGALRVELPSNVALRSSVCEAREEAKPQIKKKAALVRELSQRPERVSAQVSDLQSSRFVARKSARSTKMSNDANAITRLFEETKKQTMNGMRGVTMDVDMNVIEIQEQKTFGASLIVPKVSAKRVMKTDVTQTQPRRAKRMPIKEKTGTKKKTLPRLIEPEMPHFDEDVTDVSVSDKFVCLPGVTLREGGVVKSKPRPVRAGEITKAQYEDYRKELERQANEEG